MANQLKINSRAVVKVVVVDVAKILLFFKKVSHIFFYFARYKNISSIIQDNLSLEFDCRVYSPIYARFVL